jgi:muramoyltetrapeptide carboxypeptidase LdcA involved in peptidoglycan recycling
MRFPKLLQKGDTIGVCAPSSGVDGDFGQARMDKAHIKMREFGYQSIETPSVRSNVKFVSADAKTRATEFMNLYENPNIAAIMPPCGGEYLMEMLPHLDFSRLAELPPKWISGYSDITALTFPLTLCCDFATIHGAQFGDMGADTVDEYDLLVFEAMSNKELTQSSSDFYSDGRVVNEKTVWKSLDGKKNHTFQGRMIGGCFNVLRILLGTKFAPVSDFLERYKDDGFIWTLESNVCEMGEGDIYRTFWQMRECGWFKHCTGILFGRPDYYGEDNLTFNPLEALDILTTFLNIPVIYDTDIGHTSPRIQIINGAYGKVEYHDGKAVITQQLIL